MDLISSEGTSCGLGDEIVSVAGLVDALLLLAEVVTLEGLEVAVAGWGPELKDCFGAV